jgi:transposase-like protein
VSCSLAVRDPNDRDRTISRRRFTAEQIVSKLREAEVELSRGMSISAVARKLGVTDQTYDRWRREYGGMKVHHALEPAVLALELLQPLRLVDLHPAVLLAPAEVRHLCHAEQPTDRRHRASLAKLNVRLAELVHHVLRRVLLPCHDVPPELRRKPSLRLVLFQGGRSMERQQLGPRTAGRTADLACSTVAASAQHRRGVVRAAP